MPYKTASDLYLKSSNPADVKKIAQDARDQVERGIEQAWQQYQKVVSFYLQSSFDATVEATGDVSRAHNAYLQICPSGHCVHVNEANIIKRLQQTAVQKFYDETGYPPAVLQILYFVSERSRY